MEDVTTTSNAYSKDELAAMVRHPVVSEVTRILSLQSELEEIIVDQDRSRNDIETETREHMEQMTDIWSLLGPACVIARRLYPQQGVLFDMLDKSRSLKESYAAMAEGKLFSSEGSCDKLCCRKQLS